mmetsp:Transcript_74470/g.197803  ORF Transcript_74470/g.197803 Transcript_74470/m.197803 type:complete len:125 (-) Transcript_74470:48-422(-)
MFGPAHTEKVLVGNKEEEVVIDDMKGPRRLVVDVGSWGLNFDHAVLDMQNMGIGSNIHSKIKRWPVMTPSERNVVLYQVAKHNRSMREQHEGEKCVELWEAVADKPHWMPPIAEPEAPALEQWG